MLSAAMIVVFAVVLAATDDWVMVPEPTDGLTERPLAPVTGVVEAAVPSTILTNWLPKKI